MQAPAPGATRFGWDRLVVVSGILVVVLLLSAAAGFRDLEAAAFAAGTIVALGLMRFRTGLLALVALGVLFVDTAGWMLPGAIVNIEHHAKWVATALPSTLGISALTGLIAVVASLIKRRRVVHERRAPVLIAVCAIVAIALANVAGATSESNARHVARDRDIVIEAKGVRFSRTTLEAATGRVGIVLTNRDLFWHTFTISRLHANVRVPVGAEGRVEFDAKPGTYEFVCAIPGHAQAGMKGTLIVR